MPEVDQVLAEGNERLGIFGKQHIILLYGVVYAPHLALLLQLLEQQRRVVIEDASQTRGPVCRGQSSKSDAQILP